MTIATDRSMTLEEYLDHDDGTDTRYELVDGVLVEMGAESPLNPAIAMFLVFVFADLGIPRKQLAVGHQVGISPIRATARQPDLIVHTKESRAAIMADGKLLRYGMPAPMLVVEVVSNGDTDRRSRERDYTEKRAEYAARSIPEYWIVDPVEALVTVCTLDGTSYQVAEFRGDKAITSPTFPELKLTTALILAESL
jgi:Uma2 family endonuclease